MISIDSSGWIERLTSGPKSSRYNRIIDSASQDELITSVVVFYDVYRKIKRAMGEEIALEAVAALSQTRVVGIDPTISLEATDFRPACGLHMADAIVYATSSRYSAELYTSDNNLKKLKGVAFV